MEKITLVREIYVEAFKNWRNYVLENSFKLFTWVCFVLIGIAMYALIYRIATGFAFSNL